MLDPAVLQGLTSLTKLFLRGLRLISIDGVGSGKSLFEVLAALQQLQWLKLRDIDAVWPAAGSLSYSALVPSSTLTRLEMYNCTLPADALQHVFAPGRSLPRLQLLEAWRGSWRCAQPPFWDQAAVSNMASCCPGLRQLSLCLQLGVSVAALTQLSALTKLGLSLGDVTVEDATACVQSLAALTNLKDLRIKWAVQDSSMLTLLPLTALTNLTRLAHNSAEPASVTMYNQVRKGGCEGTTRYERAAVPHPQLHCSSPMIRFRRLCCGQ